MSGSNEACELRCPVLVVHSRGDVQAPFEEGCQLARPIPNATFLPIESASLIPFPGEPAHADMVCKGREFLAQDEDKTPPAAEFSDLSPRERDVLDPIARDLDNLLIAPHLGISEKTVRENVTRIFDMLLARCVDCAAQVTRRAPPPIGIEVSDEQDGASFSRRRVMSSLRRPNRRHSK